MRKLRSTEVVACPRWRRRFMTASAGLDQTASILLSEQVIPWDYGLRNRPSCHANRRIFFIHAGKGIRERGPETGHWPMDQLRSFPSAALALPHSLGPSQISPLRQAGTLDRECCISFRWTAKWFCYIYIHTHIYVCVYIFIFKLFSLKSYYKIEYSFLYYTVGTCWLPILYSVLCIC